MLFISCRMSHPVAVSEFSYAPSIAGLKWFPGWGYLIIISADSLPPAFLIPCSGCQALSGLWKRRGGHRRHLLDAGVLAPCLRPDRDQRPSSVPPRPTFASLPSLCHGSSVLLHFLFLPSPKQAQVLSCLHRFAGARSTARNRRPSHSCQGVPTKRHTEERHCSPRRPQGTKRENVTFCEDCHERAGVALCPRWRRSVSAERGEGAWESV